jgi:hypothetical protein
MKHPKERDWKSLFSGAVGNERLLKYLHSQTEKGDAVNSKRFITWILTLLTDNPNL